MAKLSEILIPITFPGASLAPPSVAEFGNVIHVHYVVPEPCRLPGCLVPARKAAAAALNDQYRHVDDLVAVE